jgi:hypothetical protein
LATIVSGEFFLKSGHPNGGTVILLRSIWVSTIVYAFALWLHSGSYADWTWCFWNWAIDGGRLKQEISANVQWFGAIFAAVYIALYARFAAQWSYLAGLRNKLRRTLLSLPKDLTDLDAERANQLRLWRTEFVRDAIDLHLATKSMFGPFLKRTLKDRTVQENFRDYTFDGPQRLDWLQKQLEERFPEDDGQPAVHDGS